MNLLKYCYPLTKKRGHQPKGLNNQKRMPELSGILFNLFGSPGIAVVSTTCGVLLSKI